MAVFIALVVGLVAGAVIILAVFIDKQRKYVEKKRQQDAQANKIRQTVQELSAKNEDFKKRSAEFESRLVSYDQLRAENKELKRDLANTDIQQHKLQLDVQKQQEHQRTLDERVKELGSRYMKDVTRWVGKSLTTNNFVQCKKRLTDTIERCRGIGFEISEGEEADLVQDLREQFEDAVRKEFQRQEQARIKEQIREEERIQRQADRELKRIEREREIIRTALEKALEQTEDKHSAAIEELRARLAEAEEKAQRTISQAQLTKAGHVYVISNIGSFGDNVFKIGMTRRLTPEDRVRELGSASVPFPFDVHMMISTDDAPALESKLHQAFNRHRINKANPRKEFFRTDIEAIRKVVEENHGQVDYQAEPEALEYSQSVEMTDEDTDFIEGVFERVMGEDETGAD